MNAISFDDLCPTLIGQLRDLLPQIEAALARGITMREIHRRFLKGGRQISESYFHRAVKKLRRGAIAVVDRVSDKVDSVVQVAQQVQAVVEAKLAPVGGSLMAAIEARKKEIAESAKKSPARAVAPEKNAVVAGQSDSVVPVATAPIKPKRVLPHNPSPDDHLTEEEIMSIDFYAYGGHQIRIEEGMNEDLVEAIKYGILAQRNLARGVYDGRSVVGRMMREIRLWSEELDKRAENSK